MQHLYGVSFKGKMLYFTGSISDDRVKEVEEIANQIDYALEEDAFCGQLGNAVRSKLGIEFNHQPVEHICNRSIMCTLIEEIQLSGTDSCMQEVI